MGCFDTVSVSGPEFVCSEGHDLSGEDFQTKDLGETMGFASISGGVLTFYPDNEENPDVISIYARCRQCPAFVQAETGNVVDIWCEFEVKLESGRVTAVTRTSPTTAEFLVTEPRQTYMAGCYGPMPHREAERLSWEIRRRKGWGA